MLSRAVLCVWNTFENLNASFSFISQAFCLERIFRWWWQTALLKSRTVSKLDTGMVGSVQHTLTNGLWASLYLSGSYRVSYLTFVSLPLPYFRVRRLTNGLLQAVFYDPLKHGDWRSKPLEHYKATLSKAFFSNIRSATCELSTVCHRREIVHALGVFISQPKLTLYKNKEKWRKARSMDVVSYIWDTCSYYHAEINWINFSARSSQKLSLDN